MHTSSAQTREVLLPQELPHERAHGGGQAALQHWQPAAGLCLSAGRPKVHIVQRGTCIPRDPPGRAGQGRESGGVKYSRHKLESCNGAPVCMGAQHALGSTGARPRRLITRCHELAQAASVHRRDSGPAWRPEARSFCWKVAPALKKAVLRELNRYSARQTCKLLRSAERAWRCARAAASLSRVQQHENARVHRRDKAVQTRPWHGSSPAKAATQNRQPSSRAAEVLEGCFV